jgi:small conductance mechanosensitive channel
MLLILRPYRVGDQVEIMGRTGRVHALTLFTTELTSYEGLKLILPNGKILVELIVNFSARGRRRFEVTFGIDYQDDLDRALAVLVDCAKEDARIMADPAPWAKVTALGDNAVTVTLRAWVKPNDYVDAMPDMIKRVKERFDREGFAFPYPHQVAVPFEAAHPEQAAKLGRT